MIKVYIMLNAGEKVIDISNVVKVGASLKKSTKEFAWIYEFKISRNDVYTGVKVGDIVLVKLDEKEIFTGIVVSENVSKLEFKAVDFAWYFNNNEEIYQFEDVESAIVVTKLIETFGGQVGNIETNQTMVDKFYFEKTLGEIIKDVIKNIKSLEKKEFRFFYRNTKFHFELSKKDKFLAGEYTPLTRLEAILNGYKYNALSYIEEPSLKRSIEDMKNSIKVYKTSGKEYIQVDDAKDESNIEKYGLLQKLVSYKDNDLNAGTITADSVLKDTNKIKEKISIVIPTLSQFVYDGELLQLKYDDYKINGVYEVKSVTYTFGMHNTIFKAQMELERVK